MCLVRMRQEGRAGKYMCRYIVHSMWEDVEQRSKIMGVSSVKDHSAASRDLGPLWRSSWRHGCFGLRLGLSQDTTLLT